MENSSFVQHKEEKYSFTESNLHAFEYRNERLRPSNEVI